MESEDLFRILGNPEPAITRSRRIGDWSILPDGSGIVSIMLDSDASESRASTDIPVDLVFNWFTELEERAPHPAER